MLIEVGCKRKVWKQDENGFSRTYEWVSQGNLLDDRACVGDRYKKDKVPEIRLRSTRMKRSASRLSRGRVRTKVYTTIEHQKVREVDAKKESISIDLILTMIWVDPRIRYKFSTEHLLSGGLFLGPEASNQMWTPDLHIDDRVYFKEEQEWNSLISLKVALPTSINNDNQASQIFNPYSDTLVEMRRELKVTIYCHFDLSTYPMDQQNCNLKIGSAAKSVTFVLFNETGTVHEDEKYESDNFNISVEFFDGKLDNGRNKIGLKVEMCRLQTSFIFMYYIPSISIVLVSLIGFVIPITAIPGRVGLLVTQFLTLTNLFIYQMVSNALITNLRQKLLNYKEKLGS